MSFDLSWDTLAALKGGMRIHNSGADLMRYRDCNELPPSAVVLEWNKQAASALLNSAQPLIFLNELGAKGG